ncbi:hypothetical protein [Streptomyces sp. GSL17-111]|uniref:hypothetical protein n=1 Tax=Streptomyces sp. GSL17-111 TaxID=3121596 RepID=UPI0030F47D5F
MTHRGRLIAKLIMALVLLGFGLNIVATQNRPTPAAPPGPGEEGGPPPPPVAPVYVPRPNDVLYRELAADSAPHTVARAFATGFAGLDPREVWTRGFGTDLPRVLPGERDTIVEHFAAEWSDAGGGRPFTAPRVTRVETLDGPAADGGSEGSDRATVEVTFAATGAGAADGTERRVLVHLVRGDAEGWLVASVETGEQTP